MQFCLPEGCWVRNKSRNKTGTHWRCPGEWWVVLTWSRPVTAAAAAAPPRQPERGVPARVAIAGRQVPDAYSIFFVFYPRHHHLSPRPHHNVIVKYYPSLSSSSSSAPSSVSMLLSSMMSSRSRYLPTQFRINILLICHLYIQGVFPKFKTVKTQCQDEVRTYSAGTHILKVVKSTVHREGFS